MLEEDTRARILREASALFADEGLYAFSMRKLAGRVGVSAPAIYRHFDSKEALIGAVCQEGFRLFAQYLWKALEAGDPLERLNATRLQYLRFALDHAHYYRTMFMIHVDSLGWESVPEANRERAGATFQFLVDRVHECQHAARLCDGEARLLAVQIWAHGHGLVALRLAGHLSELDDGAFEALYVRSCGAQLAGLGTMAGAPASRRAGTRPRHQR